MRGILATNRSLSLFRFSSCISSVLNKFLPSSVKVGLSMVSLNLYLCGLKDYCIIVATVF